MKTTIDELGSVTVDYEEKPRDPFCLESIRDTFAHVDKDLAYRGFRWERIAISGVEYTWSGVQPRFPADPICVHMALGLKEGEEPTKEQVFIMEYFAAQCSKSLSEFRKDGSLPTEEMGRYFENEKAQKLSPYPVSKGQGFPEADI